MNSTQQVKEFLTGLQERIVERLEEVDGKHFRRDKWERPEGGGGLSCVMEAGNVFERGGVNYSHVFGGGLPARSRQWVCRSCCIRTTRMRPPSI